MPNHDAGDTLLARRMCLTWNRAQPWRVQCPMRDCRNAALFTQAGSLAIVP